MKTEKLYGEGATKEEVVTLLTNWAEKARVHCLTAEAQAIVTEIDMVNAMTEAEFVEYVALDKHGITDTINAVEKRLELHVSLTKGLSHPFDYASRILGTNINGRPLNGYAPKEKMAGASHDLYNICGLRLSMTDGKESINSRVVEIQSLKEKRDVAIRYGKVEEAIELDGQLEKLAKEELHERFQCEHMATPTTWLEMLEHQIEISTATSESDWETLFPNHTPTSEGSKADLRLSDLPISKTMLDSLKHHPQIVDEQYKAIRFTHVMSAEHATRLINDLNHLIEITSDAEYAEALSKEVQRLQYIADGKITKPSDVDYKWVQDRDF